MTQSSSKLASKWQWPLAPINSFKTLLIKISVQGSVFLLGIITVFLISYYCHFSLAHTVVDKNYQASAETLAIHASANSHLPQHFLTQLQDHLYYIKHYEQGVPSEHQPGSSPGTWPFGNKSIIYAKEHHPSGNRYLYLQGNPVIWLLALIGVVLSLAQIIVSTVYGIPIGIPGKGFSKGLAQDATRHHTSQSIEKKQWRKRQYLISWFSLMYLSYLLVMFNLERVMYLYHYLIPLLFGLFLFYLQFQQLFYRSLKAQNPLFYLAILVLILEIFISYQFFSPLSYYYPISIEDFMQRQWMEFWHLKAFP